VKPSLFAAVLSQVVPYTGWLLRTSVQPPPSVDMSQV
jgi:hypothetical protein